MQFELWLFLKISLEVLSQVTLHWKGILHITLEAFSCKIKIKEKGKKKGRVWKKEHILLKILESGLKISLLTVGVSFYFLEKKVFLFLVYWQGKKRKILLHKFLMKPCLMWSLFLMGIVCALILLHRPREKKWYILGF